MRDDIEEHNNISFWLDDVLTTDIKSHYLADEAACLKNLLPLAFASPETTATSYRLTKELVEAVRRPEQNNFFGSSLLAPGLNFEEFLAEYSLGTEEGIALMCLAEALLRIPDSTTAQALIEDKLSEQDWAGHLGSSQSFWLNASTRGLQFTGKLFEGHHLGSPVSFIKNLTKRLGRPVAEQAIRKAMGVMGDQFIAGQTLDEALARINSAQNHFVHSFDMLGEAAVCQEDSDAYFHAYANAITTLGNHYKHTPLQTGDHHHEQWRNSISIKLSALHPRYEIHQKQRAFTELLPRLEKLVLLGIEHHVPITIDAEESYRLELSLLLFHALHANPQIRQWDFLGLAVQAYQKRALAVISWLRQLADEYHKVIPVRLVKGAYWDSEIKYAQQAGHQNYPVWTRKINTDCSYIACAHQLFKCENKLYPQFATHNAHSVARIMVFSQQYPLIKFELQRLHGMGDVLYQQLSHMPAFTKLSIPVRVYEPVGCHKDLLAYLVRRLLENGANTSFVHAVTDQNFDLETFCQEPADIIKQEKKFTNSKIPLPEKLYGASRINSFADNLFGLNSLNQVLQAVEPFLQQQWHALALGKNINSDHPDAPTRSLTNPANIHDTVGTLTEASEQQCKMAIDSAHTAFYHWHKTPAEQRAALLEKTADLFEKNRFELMALCIREAGKTYANAIGEIREAIDFFRYYAAQCRQLFAKPSILPGPTGEENSLLWQGRGVFLCISPWNFPLAIFVGQISAALAAGNTVLAKPASNTPLLAHRALELFYQAGIPQDALYFLPAKSRAIANTLLSDKRLAGVAFTGSTEAAQSINLQLAQRHAPLATVVAETGGQNALIADSSALPEQIVKDAVISAFDSAGQRCSALRVLFLQQETADAIIRLLKGAMAELKIGDPGHLSTDIGPVIDSASKKSLMNHIKQLQADNHESYSSYISPALHQHGHFVPPTLLEIDSLEQLDAEHFGPILHVIRYDIQQLDNVIASINNTGYGLTLGIHTRIQSRAEYIAEHVNAGNIYINRNMIGATVGVQPFGGMGLSGTGPKAGGPNYLQRFACEKACSNNIAAVGGNTRLLNLQAE